jgi:hypothetical protein
MFVIKVHCTKFVHKLCCDAAYHAAYHWQMQAVEHNCLQQTDAFISHATSAVKPTALQRFLKALLH